MEIKITPSSSSGATSLFGLFFKDRQISKSKMFVDENTQEMDFSKDIYLSNNREHTIKILLEGNLEDASYMFEYKGDMKIKFYKNFNDTKRRIFDKSKLKNMKSMFASASNIEIDLSFFNTSNVKDMESMFAYSSNLNSINLTSLQTKSVENMREMFRETKLTSLDLSSFDTSLVTDMSYMFYKSRITSLDLSNFNTKSVRDMNNMFSQCGYITSLDLSSFSMEKVLNISNIFEYCRRLKNIKLWKLGKNSEKKLDNLFSYLLIENLDLSTVNKYYWC